MFFGQDLAQFIQAVGLLGVFSIIFAESGLLIGFFLPGDSLLFTAGVLASFGTFDFWVLMIGCIVAAIAGDSVGYTFGRRIGPRIFKREDSILFHKDHILRAQNFYAKHGGKAIVFARFMPAIRTFAPIVAGVGKMHYPTFLFYNIFGGIFWVTSLTTLGYFFGNAIPRDKIDLFIMPVLALIILASVVPGIVHVWRENPEGVKRQLRSVMARLRGR